MKFSWIITLFIIFLISSESFPNAKHAISIYPIPQELEKLTGHFQIDNDVAILIPSPDAQFEKKLANILEIDLVDNYHLYPAIMVSSAGVPGRRLIVMGTIDNPLVKSCCESNHIDISNILPRILFISLKNCILTH